MDLPTDTLDDMMDWFVNTAFWDDHDMISCDTTGVHDFDFFPDVGYDTEDILPSSDDTNGMHCWQKSDAAVSVYLATRITMH